MMRKLFLVGCVVIMLFAFTGCKSNIKDTSFNSEEDTEMNMQADIASMMFENDSLQKSLDKHILSARTDAIFRYRIR